MDPVQDFDLGATTFQRCSICPEIVAHRPGVHGKERTRQRPRSRVAKPQATLHAMPRPRTCTGLVPARNALTHSGRFSLPFSHLRIVFLAYSVSRLYPGGRMCAQGCCSCNRGRGGSTASNRASAIGPLQTSHTKMCSGRCAPGPLQSLRRRLAFGASISSLGFPLSRCLLPRRCL